MKRQKDSPSTAARRLGYIKLHRLGNLLRKMLFPDVYYDLVSKADPHWILTEFNVLGWKDYMVRHTPKDKLGGPEKQLTNKKKSKLKDRKGSVR